VTASGEQHGKRSDLPRRLGDILTPSLERIVGSDEARAYSAWSRAVGEPVTRGTRPKAFRRGQLTVECASSVWANELTYLGPQILRRMDEVAPGHPVERFRFVVGRLPAPDAREGGAEAGPKAAPETSPEESGNSAAKKKRRHHQPAPDVADAARTEAEGVQDGRLRAAIEAALRRLPEEPSEAPGRGTPSG
jgi:hypothetical protein